MFQQTDIEVANKTSRANGAVGQRAITPKQVREYLELFCSKEDTTVLDFGAGKTAAHQRALLELGWAVTAHEFGDNIDVRFHNELALMNRYDVVYASNVLNVQSSVDMARTTIEQIAGAVKNNGCFFGNYPSSPRKSDISGYDMVKLLQEQFSLVHRVGGTVSAPLWMCKK